MTDQTPLHPDFTKEWDRLEFTKRYLLAVIATAETSKNQFQENMKRAFGDVDFIESSAAYTDLLTNASFYEISKDELESLRNALHKPYFARLDFKREGGDQTEKHYIGKTSLYHRENQDQIIVDWRSPIANLYYEGRIGRVEYNADGGLYRGDLSLKRQFMIEQGQLDEIRDIDLTTTDELLQESLAKSSSNRLTEIITTIQEEQNRIIRADLNRPIIVQGAAGSGKTTIALHRISYFIYNYKQFFDPTQLMILAPSKLFIDYISEALPELGVDRVKQTTFSEYTLQCINEEKLTLMPDEKLVSLLENPTQEDILASKVSGFKGSKLMKEILDYYIQEIYLRFVPKEDFYVEKYRLYSAQKFTKLLIEEYYYLPLYKRVEKLKKLLQSTVRTNKSSMLNRIEKFFDDRIEIALFRKESEERRAYVTKALDNKEERLKSLKISIRKAVTSYMKQFEKKKLLTYYAELYQDPLMLIKRSKGRLTLDQAEEICDYTTNHIRNKSYEVEDLAPLLYLQTHLFGVEKEYKVKNVVIDEAQDYSYLQIQSLKTAFETDMFTLVGDLAQGIHSYRGLTSWDAVCQEIFPRATYTELQKSYRTTVEIMETANELLARLPYPFPKVNPVVRHGERPEFIEVKKESQIADSILKKVEELREEEYQTFAVIGKTMKDCERIAIALEKNDQGSIKLLKEQASIPKDKIVVVPSYLAKGLEFDVVMIVSIKESFSVEEELDIKLLYVSMTRPLHRLFFYGEDKERFLLD
ncbi:RNA polymerase recycling motor HelD [Bacillus sp. 2205SS5-2]|uniref:RNA polymerase recycling motor HelD n=1 Tax=Bacillus sp. 2205SS5-2 TaxID=3109031 RepID=UPI003005D9C8